MLQLLSQSQRALPRSNTTLTRRPLASLRNFVSTTTNSPQPSHTRRTSRRTTPISPRTAIPQIGTFPVTIRTRNMSSDADYASFLDRANQDTGSAQQQSSSKKKSYGTKSVDTAVPQALEKVEEYYISDADEPFEPVALKYSGSSIFADDVKELLGGDVDVEEVKGSSFTKQYQKVVDAVKEAGSGDVKVFKVQIDGTRAEFYVVAVDEKEGRVVGLKALSVES